VVVDRATHAPGRPAFDPLTGARRMSVAARQAARMGYWADVAASGWTTQVSTR
jgi:hypothetical protein